MSNITGKEVDLAIRKLMAAAKEKGFKQGYDSSDHENFLRTQGKEQRVVVEDLESIRQLSPAVDLVLSKVITQSEWGKPLVRVTKGGDAERLGSASIAINSPVIIDGGRFAGFGLLAHAQEVTKPAGEMRVTLELESESTQEDEIFSALAWTLRNWPDKAEVCQNAMGMVDLAEMILGLTEPPKRKR